MPSLYEFLLHTCRFWYRDTNMLMMGRLLPASTSKTRIDRKLILTLCQIWKNQFSWKTTAA